MNLEDYILIAGVMLIAGGMWWVYPPLALVVLGGILISGAMRIKRDADKEKKRDAGRS
jgi:hypothetical protein